METTKQLNDMSEKQLKEVMNEGREASHELSKRHYKDTVLSKRHYKDTVEILESYVGKYYKYPRNSYSLPEGEDDYWDTYRKYYYTDVEKRNDYEFVIVVGVEWYIDSEGEIHIKQITEDRELLRQWEECTQEEAENEYKRITIGVFNLHTFGRMDKV